MDDRIILRELAKSFAETAALDVNAERVERYRKVNALQEARPPVLVFEVPWGEISDCEELRCRCTDPAARALEWDMRAALYQWKYFQGDYALHPYARCPVAVRNSGIGLSISEDASYGDTGTSIYSHHYKDQIPDIESLEKIRMPEITLDEEGTQKRLALYSEVFNGMMPVKKAGVGLYFASWDHIPRLHGVENCLMDLYDDPEYIHALMERMTQVNEHELDRYEALNILDTDAYYLHCTPAATYELPVKDIDTDNITAKDVWCRAMAQILAVVSPDMVDEFDLQYTERLFNRCGLSYYGCCEPLHDKIEKLRRFKNLRRISITPWADVDVAADKIAGDYVLSYKPNPAFVAAPQFDPAPVEAEIRKVLEACRRTHTPCEFILKDISTISGRTENLTRWVETANRVIDEFYA